VPLVVGFKAPVVDAGATTIVDKPDGADGVLVPVPMVTVPDAGVADDVVKTEPPEPEPPAVIANWLDWARMVSGLCESLQKLTWKPLPTGRPPLGELRTIDPPLPLTEGARRTLLVGNTVRSWLTRNTAKEEASVSTRFQDKVFGPLDVQPEMLVGL